MAQDRKEVGIHAINLGARIALLDTNEQIPVTDMFDRDGADTEDATKAVFVVAGPDRRGKWYNLNITSFQPCTLH